MKCVEVNLGDRKIQIIDNIFTLHERIAFYEFYRKSSYSIGWEDDSVIENQHLKYMHCRLYEKDLKALNFMPGIMRNSFTGPLTQSHSIGTIVTNLSFSNNTYYNHTHIQDKVLLYYGNMSWKTEWAGETLFFNDDGSEIVYATPYVPGRVIVFDGQIPHTIRPQAASAPHFRFTMGMFWQKK